MEKSYISKVCHDSGDNSEKEYHGKRDLSAPGSAKYIRKAVENILTLPSKTLDLSEKKIQHLTEDIYRLPDLQVSKLLWATLYNYTFGIHFLLNS